MIVSDFAEGPSNDWRETEIPVANIRWRTLDVENIVEGRWVDKPYLTLVHEVGFTDLMSRGGSDACPCIDWIEVWAEGVPRMPH